MTKPLSEDEKAIKAYERAVPIALAALQEIVDLHAMHKDGTDLKYCSLCFKNWPCETHKFAEKALAKMKGQLPR